MDLKQLRHLVTVIEQGSFSRAAEIVAISQPALTRSIKLLEQNLGKPLLERTTRKVSPTEAGARLYVRAKVILKEAEEAFDAVKQDDVCKRILKIGTAPMFATTITPAAVRAFTSQMPDVEVSVESGLFDTLADRLVKAELDVIVSNLPYGAIDQNLVSQPLIDIEVLYIASAKHPLASSNRIRVSDLLDYPWAVIDESHANDLYMNIFANQGAGVSPIRVRTNSLTTLKSLVEVPPWITLLPYHIVQTELDRKQLCALDVKGDQVRRRGGIVSRRTQADNQDIKRFSDCVRSVCNITR